MAFEAGATGLSRNTFPEPAGLADLGVHPRDRMLLVGVVRAFFGVLGTLPGPPIPYPRVHAAV